MIRMPTAGAGVRINRPHEKQTERDPGEPTAIHDRDGLTVPFRFMKCSGCRLPMERRTYDTPLGGKVDIDVCTRCRAFWFDPFETLHLTPRATLELIAFIGEQQAEPRPWPQTLHCPRCAGELKLAHDRQRATPFQYWICDAGHGRFETFVDFLREKDYIRALTQQQIADMRNKIQFVHCANCGAAIDLTHDSVCQHCSAPISMIDMKKMEEIAREARTPAKTLVLPALRPDPKPVDLVDAALKVVSSWVRSLLE